MDFKAALSDLFRPWVLHTYGGMWLDLRGTPWDDYLFGGVETDYRAIHGQQFDTDGRLHLRVPFSHAKLPADQLCGLYADTFRLRYEEQFAYSR